MTHPPLQFIFVKRAPGLFELDWILDVQDFCINVMKYLDVSNLQLVIFPQNSISIEFLKFCRYKYGTMFVCPFIYLNPCHKINDIFNVQYNVQYSTHLNYSTMSSSPFYSFNVRHTHWVLWLVSPQQHLWKAESALPPCTWPPLSHNTSLFSPNEQLLSPFIFSITGRKWVTGRHLAPWPHWPSKGHEAAQSTVVLTLFLVVPRGWDHD